MIVHVRKTLVAASDIFHCMSDLRAGAGLWMITGTSAC